MLQNVSIARKLQLGFGMLVLILLSLGWAAYINFSRLDEASALDTHTFEVLLEVRGLMKSAVDRETGERGFLLTGDEKFLEPLEQGQRLFTEHLNKTQQLTHNNPRQQERIQQLLRIDEKWVSSYLQPILALRRDVSAGRAELPQLIARVREAHGKQFMDELRAICDAMEQEEFELLSQRRQRSEALVETMYQMLVGGGLAGVLVALIFSTLLARSISGPLAQAVTLTRQLATGDLTVTIEPQGEDEPGLMMAGMKEMVHRLTDVLSEARSATLALSSASEQVSSAAQALSQGTSTQAASVEETTSNIQQFNGSISQNAETSRQLEQMALESAQSTEESGQAVTKTVSAMNSITEKISIVEEIAYQTNLLALNAAVEAARAGQHGRGFAVVATEVRKLAERSQAAAKEIGVLASSSVKVADRSGQLLADLVPSIRKTTKLVQEVSAACKEQTLSVGQIGRAMQQIDRVTQRNASAAEELSSTAEELEAQAEALQQTMSFFRLATDSSRETPPRHMRPGLALRLPAAQGPRATAVTMPSSMATQPRAGVEQEESASDKDFQRF